MLLEISTWESTAGLPLCCHTQYHSLLTELQPTTQMWQPATMTTKQFTWLLLAASARMLALKPAPMLKLTA